MKVRSISPYYRLNSQDKRKYDPSAVPAGGGEGMEQPDPVGVCTRDDDRGCSSAETRGVIPRGENTGTDRGK